MFKLKDDYFSKIKCPELRKANKKCSILNCIFRHESDAAPTSKKRPLPDTEPMDSNKRRVEAADAKETTEKATKEKNSEVASGKDISFIVPKSISHLNVARSVRTINTRKIANCLKTKEEHPTPNKAAINKEYEIALKSKSVREYEVSIDKIIAGPVDEKKDPKYILPREVTPRPPAGLPMRKQYIQIMVDTLKKSNPSLKTPILESIEHEYKVASASTSSTYVQAVKKKIYEMAHPEKFNVVKKTPSKSDYSRMLKELAIPKEKLRKYGFIMDIPAAEQPQEDRICRRCNNEFKLSEILTPTECHYHSGKVIKKDPKTRVYECCGGIVGGETDTCEVSKHHVFYWLNPQEMQAALPFRQTSEIFKENKDSFEALGIDCEMGFTSKGFELLRITAVDFFSGEEVIDILVRPVGEVIDLNTKWSGIAEIKDEALSFEESIKLMETVMDKNTILIGHGLENDMNSMRLIHDNIVDTAILYPKHKTTPTFRFPLKHLTFKYLGRTIQTGQHDSMEDSLAAIDVVKYFINQDFAK